MHRFFAGEYHKAMLLGLSKDAAVPMLGLPEMHYFWRIRHAPGSNFEKSEQNSHKE